MVPVTAVTGVPHPDAVEFVRFCYHRRRVGWPDLYDEMCAVAGRGLFRGYSADDLGGIGVGFSLFDMPALASLACRVVAEEAALRRPVSVRLSAAATAAAEVAFDPPASAPAPMVSPTAASQPAEITLAAAVTEPSELPDLPVEPESTERSIEVPIGLALASSRT